MKDVIWIRLSSRADLSECFEALGSFSCRFFARFFGALCQLPQNLLSPFSNNAGFFCMDVQSIRSKSNDSRDYENSPLKKMESYGGIFIFFNRNTKKILYVGSSAKFYPPRDENKERSSTGSGGSTVVRIINGNYLATGNKVLPDIDDYSIFFLCLQSIETVDFDAEIKKLSKALKDILKPTIPD